MTRPDAGPVAAMPISRRVLPWLPLLFIGSGCAALIYEVVWFQMLQLIVGSSAISMGVVLGTFMGGMCLGSLYLPRVVSTARHPLRVYAALEAGVGLFGLLILWGLPYAGGLYVDIAGHGMSGLFLRGVFCAICLLPPTLLMGASLPAVARWVEATPRGVSWLGFFYGGNIVGAVLGAFLAGFYLLRVFDVSVATYVAVAINVVIAAASVALARFAPHTAPPVAEAPDESPPATGAWPVYVAIALSGMTALGAEVVWTRLLTLVLGGTVYAFSLILASILIGLGIGSTLGSVGARTIANARAALGWCQLLLMLAIAWAAWSLSSVIPFWPIDPTLASRPLFMFEVDLVRCLWTVFPAAVLWGASFPLALAAVATRQRDSGRVVGTVYAANTVGAIIGAVLTSLVFIAAIGTRWSQRVLIALAAVAALLMLVPAAAAALQRQRWSASGLLKAVTITAVAALMIVTVRPVSPLLVAYGRNTASWVADHADVFYVGEGMNSSMAVSRTSYGTLNYHNAGKIQASSEPQDMRLQRMLGHITTLVSAHPSSVLVIGCGAGVTAGAVSVDPAVQHETIAEIEPLVPRVVSRYFSKYNFAVVDNPKVTVQIDDARHFILTTDQKFDAVTSDPFDPWVRGAATLYTREFFELVKRHLNPGGVVTLFVQLYESSPATVKSELATFFEAFPNGVVWGNTENGKGYDLVLLGEMDPKPIDLDAIDQKLADPAYEVVAQSLREIGFNSAEDLFSTYGGNGPGLKPYLADAQVNRDRNLRLQYLAGLGLNEYRQADIYADMLRYRQYPEGLFTGSPQRMDAVRAGILGEP